MNLQTHFNQDRKQKGSVIVNIWKIDMKEMVTGGVTHFLLVVNIYEMRV